MSGYVGGIASQRAPVVVALLLGCAAAATAVPAVVGGVRPWHLLVILALTLASCNNPTGLARLRLGGIEILAVLLSGWLFFAELANSHELRFGAEPVSATLPVFLLLAYWASRIALAGTSDVAPFLRSFVAPGYFVALLAIGQALLPDQFRFVTVLAPSEALEARFDTTILIRATGLTGHWTGFGHYITVCIAVACILLLTRGANARASFRTFIGLGVLLAGAFATTTFTTIGVSLVLVALTVVLNGVRLDVVLAAGIAAAVVIWVFGDIFFGRWAEQGVGQVRIEGIPSWTPNTIAYRIKIWAEQTLPAISERPVTGWGSGLYSFSDPGRLYPRNLVWGSAESQWLASSVQSGIPAAVLVLALYVAVLVRLSPHKTNMPQQARAVFRALVIATIVASMLSPALTNHGFPVAFWAALGALVSWTGDQCGTGSAGSATVAVRVPSHSSSEQVDEDGKP
ncbi:O-antigen ligase family protein [Agromyces indicus]|uniref:O-antigen ligase family protein n=1 Tax=Agromyces indicus TaxID=758919 RepID=A0ABU1FIJ2_9MICO|nr:O-antigen ligase family protein [Agromyces indicus]MDR5691580.1 O-antigen ligase family protein [Agromyces indicus]